MLHVILYQPEIPPNTGNVIRLCANTGSILHLIEPLGFDLDDRNLRRAGLDYHEYTSVVTHKNVEACLVDIGPCSLFTFSTHHDVRYDTCDYSGTCALMFGPETRGLPVVERERAAREHRVTLPMRPDSRSLNLSNTVAIAVYEAWRQQDFLQHP